MPKFKSFLFDQNIFVEFADVIRNTPLLLTKMHFSSVVLYDLAATTISAGDLDLYERWLKVHDKGNTLLTPDKTDWWETAKMIRRLRFGDRFSVARADSKTPTRASTPKRCFDCPHSDACQMLCRN